MAKERKIKIVSKARDRKRKNLDKTVVCSPYGLVYDSSKIPVSYLK